MRRLEEPKLSMATTRRDALASKSASASQQLAASPPSRPQDRRYLPGRLGSDQSCGVTATRGANGQWRHLQQSSTLTNQPEEQRCRGSEVMLPSSPSHRLAVPTPSSSSASPSVSSACANPGQRSFGGTGVCLPVRLSVCPGRRRLVARSCL